MHDFGHFHTHEEEMIPDVSQLSSEYVTLNTVGIDIGSSTTHLIFSRIVLQREGKRLSSRFVVVEREVLYCSPIYLTPYKNPTIIDTDKLREYFQDEYEKAGQSPETVDTGAVIVTGEAAMKQNAGNIIALFATQSGKFVCASAGPNLEASLAGHGSGAVGRSFNKTILNVDIGGGTTKFALARNGHLLDTAAVSIGARLMAWNEEGRLIRVEKTSQRFLSKLPRLGDTLSEEEKIRFVQQMSERLFEIIEEILRGKKASPEAKGLYITPEFKQFVPVDEIMFSGGVAEYIYQNEHESRGDFGHILGPQILDLTMSRGLSLGIPNQRIRATVIGASQYTIQLSGNTIYLSAPNILPIRNVPVLSLDLRDHHEHELSHDHHHDHGHNDHHDDHHHFTISVKISEACSRYDIDEGRQAVALAVRWPAGIDYSSLRSFCSELYTALPKTMAQSDFPLILSFDADIGGLVGQLLQEEFDLRCPVISIDQVDVRDLDFIDIGEPIQESGVVPVIIKSLVFK